MSCYEEVHQLASHAFDPAALDAVLEEYGSEVYIASATHFVLYGSRFEIIERLVEYAAELIDWGNPPAPLVSLLEVVDDDGILESGDPAACRALCHRIIRVNNLTYRWVTLAVFAYYLERAESCHDLHVRLAEDHLDALRHADR